MVTIAEDAGDEIVDRPPAADTSGDTDTGADAGTAVPEGDGKRHPIKTWWRETVLHRIDAVPLTVKLVACTLVLLTVGTFGISLTIRQLVDSYLIDKTDTQLRDQAPLIYNSAKWLDERQGVDPTNTIPNEYFMQYRDVNNKIIYTPLVPVLKDDVVCEPVLPANGSMGDVQLGKPFTTNSRVVNASAGADEATLQRANAPWRVLALARQDRRDDGTQVTTQVVYIGLSMADQIDIVDTLTQDAIYVSIAIILLGALIGTLLIRRTLAPLKRMEKTAAKIAAGDLSRRVPTAPKNTEVGSLAASLNVMLARIESSFREQRETTEKMKRFVSDASHELRTPLAAIHGYAELYTMQRELPGALERADDSIDHIKASSSRMTVLVEDLLSLARLDEGRGIDLNQEVHLGQLLSDAADDLHALDPGRDVQLGTLRMVARQDDAPARLVFEEGKLPQVELTGDVSRLRQVITNIVGNIHRYTPSDSLVEMGLSVMSSSMSSESLQRMPSTARSLQHFLGSVEVGSAIDMSLDYAVLSVIDHGPGVPEDKQAQIFERFYTADPSRARQKGGTGLGMSIAQSVIRAHGGFICATTTPGGGLTLTAVVPMSGSEAQRKSVAGDYTGM